MQLTIIFIAIIVASLVNVSTCNFAEGGDMRNVVLEQMNDELYGEESGYNVGFVTHSDLENDEKKRMEHQPDSIHVSALEMGYQILSSFRCTNSHLWTSTDGKFGI